MRSKAKKQSRLRKIMIAPIKVVCKASQFYSKCMEECNGKMNYSGVVLCPVPQPTTTMTRSFSGNSRYSKGISNRDDETKKLLRSVATRRTAIEVEKQVELTQTSTELQRDLQRSYRVRVGQLGRIDENEACSFNEEDHLLYSKSKTCRTRKNYLYY